jgi:Ca2+-binding RTX toxin-like protein
VVVVNDSSVVEAYIGNNAAILAADSVSVSATSNQTLYGETGQVSTGAVAMGASFVKVSVGNDSAVETQAFIGDNVDIGQSTGSVGSVSVSATSDITAKAETLGLSAGIGAFTVNFAFVDLAPEVKASIGSSSKINVSGDVNVTSFLTVDADAKGVGASAGGLAVGAMIADVSLGRGDNYDEVEAGVGSNTTVDARALRIKAEGTNDLFADSLAGSGGVVGVAGASAKISDDNTVRAHLGDGARVTVRTLEMTSIQDHDIDSTADSYTLGLAAGSGAFARNTITGKANVDIGSNITVAAGNIFITAANLLTKQKLPAEESNLRSGSAALANLSILESRTDIGTASHRFEAVVNIGNGTTLAAGKNSTTAGTMEIQAFNNVLAVDSVRIESVSVLLSAAKGLSILNADTLVGINVNGATLENISGDIYLTTRSSVSLYPSANLLVASGLIGVGAADAHATIDATNQIDITNATIKASDVYIYAGRSSASSLSEPNYLYSIANAEITTFSLLPGINVPDVSAVINETNTINIGGDTKIQAFENVNLLAQEGIGGSGRAKTEGVALSLSLIPYGMSVPEGDDVNSVNTVNIGNNVRIEAGINNKALVHLKPLSVSGVDQPSVDPILGTVRSRLVSLGLNDDLLTVAEKSTLGLDAELEYEYAYLNPNAIALSVSQGTAIRVVAGAYAGGSEGHYYAYKASTGGSDSIVLENENYANTSRWTDLGSSPTPAQLDALTVYDSDVTKNFKSTLQNKMYVIKPVNLELPAISYVNVANLLLEQRETLLSWMASHGTNTEAIARYQVQLEALEQTLEDLGLAEWETDPGTGQLVFVAKNALDMLFVEMPDMYASPGSIFIEADEGAAGTYTPQVGTQLVARADAKIDIFNETPLTMSINDAIIKDNRRVTVVDDELVVLTPGNVYFNNASLTDADIGIGGLASISGGETQLTLTGHQLEAGDFVRIEGVTQSGWDALNGVHEVLSTTANTFRIAWDTNGVAPTYNPLIDAGTATSVKEINILQNAFLKSAYDFGGLVIPDVPQDIYIPGRVINENGNLTIDNREGNINVSGEIRAENIVIKAQGDFNLSTEDWLHSNKDPRQYIDYTALRNDVFHDVSGLPDHATYTDTDSAPGPDGGSGTAAIALQTLETAINNDYASILAQGRINITARYLNINGLIQSGIDTIKLYIDSGFNPGPYTTTFTDSDGTPLAGLHFDDPDDSSDIPVPVDGYFDAAQQAIVVEELVPKGGSITLAGQVFSTGNGRLKVANGYTNVEIQNDSNYDLVLDRIDVTTFREGEITIINTTTLEKVEYAVAGSNIEERVYNGIFIPASGGDISRIDYIEDVGEYQTHSFTDDIKYYPTVDQHYVWTEGQEKSHVEVYHYEKKSFNLIGFDWDALAADGSWTDREIYNRDATLLLESEAVALEDLTTTDVPNYADGTAYTVAFERVSDKIIDLFPGQTLVKWLVEDDEGTPLDGDGKVYRYKLTAPAGEAILAEIDYGTDSNWELVDPQPPTFEQNPALKQYYSNFENVTVDEFKDSWGGGWLRTKTYYTRITTVTGIKDYFTHTLKADYPVDIEFIQGHDNPAILVNSVGDIRLQGEIAIPEEGTITLTSTGGSVIQTSTAAIFGANPTVAAAGGVVINLEGNLDPNKGAPATPNVLNVTSNEDVRVILVSEDQTSSIVVGQVIANGADVILQAADGIQPFDNTSFIKGNRVELFTKRGSIGSDSEVLRIDSAAFGSGGVAAGADEDIFLKELSGDMYLVEPEFFPQSYTPQASIQSVSGQIHLETVSGSILDAYYETFRPLSAEKVTLLDQRMQLTGSGAQAAAEAAIRTEENTETTLYHSYWQTYRDLAKNGIAAEFEIIDIDESTDEITFSTAHGLSTGDQLFFSLGLDLGTEDYTDANNWSEIIADHDVSLLSGTVSLSTGELVLSAAGSMYLYQGVNVSDYDFTGEDFSNGSIWVEITPDYDVSSLDADARIAVRAGKVVKASDDALYHYKGERITSPAAALTSGEDYYVIVTDPDKVKLAATRYDALISESPVAIDIELSVYNSSLAGVGALRYNYTTSSYQADLHLDDVDLHAEDFNNLNKWQLLPDYDLDALTPGTLVDLDTDMIVRTAGDLYYQYQGVAAEDVDLSAEDFSETSKWAAVSPDHDLTVLTEGALVIVADGDIVQTVEGSLYRYFLAKNLRPIHDQYGDQAYDPDFIYQMSQAEKDARIAERTFSADALNSPLPPGLMSFLYPDTPFLGPSPDPFVSETPNVIGGDVFLFAGGNSGQIGRVTGRVTVDLSSGFSSLSAADKEILSGATADDVMGKSYALYKYTGATAELDLRAQDFNDTNLWDKVIVNHETGTDDTIANDVSAVHDHTVVLVQYTENLYGLYRYLGSFGTIDLAQQDYSDTFRWEAINATFGTSQGTVNVQQNQLVADQSVVESVTLQIWDDIDVEAADSFSADAGDSIAVQTEGALKISYVEAGGDVRLIVGDAITDLYVAGTDAAVTAFGDLILSSGDRIEGDDGTSQLRIQLSGASKLSADAQGEIHIEQVSADAVVRGTSELIDNLHISRVTAGHEVEIEVIEGDMYVGKVISGTSVDLIAQNDILDAFNDADATIINIFTNENADPGDVHLEARTGDIGSNLNFLDVEISKGELTSLSSDDTFIHSRGSLNVREVTASSGDAVLDVDGNANIDMITATAGTVAVRANLAIVDWREDGNSNIDAKNVVLNAEDGTIGTSNPNPFEIDSSNATAGTVTAEASGEIYLVETFGNMRVNTIVSESNDVTLIADGSILDANNDFALDIPGLTLAFFNIAGLTPTDLNISGVNINLMAQTGSIGTDTDAVEIDSSNPDKGWLNATAHNDIYLTEVAGELNVGLVSSAHGDVGLNVRDSATTGEDLLMDLNAEITAPEGSVFLNAGDNAIFDAGSLISSAVAIVLHGDFGDTGNNDAAVGTVITVNGSIIAPEIEIYGDSEEDTITIDVLDYPDNEITGHVQVFGGSGEDLITVNRLHTRTETMDIDGQGGTDTVIVNTSGSLSLPAGGAYHDYLINVLDTGAKDDGSDTLTINGTADPDIFLLRRASYIPDHPGAQSPAFVALLHGEIDEVLADDPSRPGEVERINYDENINARLTVNGLGGNDYFASDDNSAITTLDGGAGDDTFQIGQVYKSERVTDDVAPEDEFTTVLTTRGYLSSGVTFPTVIYGGTGHDRFSVYSNKAELRLEGNAGNDEFIIRAFALAGTTDRFSTEETTKVEGGEGEDFIQYNINAPVDIDGGPGFDKIVVIGTEFGDNFTITDQGVFGAGLNISYEGVESVEVDGMEGDDDFFVLSTKEDLVTTVIGGLGSDTVNVGGDVTQDIISMELEGRSGVINHKVISATDDEYDNLPAPGLALNVADPATLGQVIVDDMDGSVIVGEHDGGTTFTDMFRVRLSGTPSANVYVNVSAARSPSEEDELGGDTILLSSGSQIDVPALVLTFDNANWNSWQTVDVRAVDDTLAEGERLVVVSHSTASADSTFDQAAVTNLKVTVRDDDRAGLIINESDNKTLVLEGDATTGIFDSYDVSLTRAPLFETTVTVQLTHDSQVVLSSLDTRFNAVTETITFRHDNWNDPITIDVAANDDGDSENRVISKISHTVSAATTDPTFDFVGAATVKVEVLDNETAGLLVTETGGDTLVTSDGTDTDTYTIRLTSAPAGDVTVNILTDGQTDIVTGGRIFKNDLSVPETIGVTFTDNATDPDDTRDMITRTDGKSWSDEGYRVGQLIRIADSGSNDGEYKINAIHDDVITLTADASLADETTDVNITEFAPAVTFGTSNWYEAVTIEVKADPDYVLESGEEFIKEFPLQEHQLNRIGGPLIVEGYVIEGADRSLARPVMLPGEINALDSDGDVEAFTEAGSGSTIDTMTVATSDLETLAAGMELDAFVALLLSDHYTLEISAGDGLGWFWQIVDVDVQNGGTVLSLLRPSVPETALGLADPFADWPPTSESKYAITRMSPTFFVEESEQIDVLNVFNDASKTNDVGGLERAAFENDLITLGDPLNLSGLNMAGDLTVDISEAQDGSNLQTIIGGITFDDMEIFDLMLGKGNDMLTIRDTLTTDADHGGITFIHGAGNWLANPLLTTSFGSVQGDYIKVEGGGEIGSPLVIYGDTSQDGSRYSGESGECSENAIAFDHAGNDVIDASAVSTSVTIFGGRGNDIIAGSQVGDHIAGGSGNDLIYGQAGNDHIYGDSGFNVDRDSREIDVVNTNASSHPNHDDLAAGADEVYGELDDDIILGDYGVIEQTEGTLRILTTGNVERIRTVNPSLGGDDTLEGNDGIDRILGGYGEDTVIGHIGDDIIIGDSGVIDYNTGDDDLATVDSIYTTSPAIGSVDNLTGSEGDDIMMGGTASDTIHAGAGVDLVFGDQGEVLSSGGANQIVTYWNEEAPWYEGYTYTAIFTQDDAAGAGDLIYGEGGGDYILGQQGADVIYGGGGDDDIYGGHNVAGGHDSGDYIDSGTYNDVVVGDNASIQRTGTAISPRFRALVGTVIYGEDVANDGLALVTDDSKADPYGNHTRDVVLFDSSHDPDPTTFGNDTIAGGADDDVVFGQIGDDTLHGDGQIEALVLKALVDDESTNDEGGDDYIEGNGGNDIIYGGLGQDDIIGGNSILFGLDLYDERPGGSDAIYGGNGDMLVRNNLGDLNETGHARDADMILGDNGNIYRLVGTNGNGTGAFLAFYYDNPAFGYSADLKIIPRAAELIDYTPGGQDYFPTAAQAEDDIGAADEIHGESGDDFIYGMKGDDVLFGEGQDDDIIGGYDNDWISGGTGQDGILGDDGRIYTSRNSSTTGESLYGIEPLLLDDPSTKTINGNVLNEVIYTPGKIQQATINVSGELKKTVNLTPFKLGDPEFFDYADQDPQYADDIIYGGWGDDFLHGGAGDDAISGAEALPLYYSNPENPGDVLKFGVYRGGEFGAYNEYDPWSKVYVNAVGEFVTPDDPDFENAKEFLLNFDHTEGPSAGIHDSLEAFTDGNDVIFGDVGNDWLVGGTGRDNLYGGYGYDLLNADDNHDSTNNDDGNLTPEDLANNIPDTHPSYEDLAYGGAGRDVFIANTGGDRLVDWAGEFNSYIVPFAPFGMATVSRTLQPQLMEYLYALSASDGADPTRAADTGAAVERNGEPEGELGLVKQKDIDWHDQTGAPDDPQPGNIPGGKRDVLRSSTFNTGTMEGMFVDSGVFSVENGALKVSAESIGGDAVAVYHVDEMLPQYFEIRASISMEKPTSGWKANSYIIFDYQSPTDFKFAGLNASIDKIQIGHRDETGWHVDVQDNMKIKPGNYYNILLAVNSTTVTVLADDKEYFSHTFAPRVDAEGWVYALNSGMIGFGSDNSRGVYDNIAVQILPPEITLEGTEEFPDTDPIVDFAPVSGSWQGSGGDLRYDGAPINGDDMAISLVDLGLDHGLEVDSVLELETTLSTANTGGLIFDYYDADNFKFAAIDAENGQLTIGHHTSRGWTVDAAYDMAIDAGTDYDLNLSQKGNTVNASVKAVDAENWQGLAGYVYNAVTVDGDFGLLTKDGVSSFDEVAVKTDDPAFETPDNALPMLAAAPLTDANEEENSINYDDLDPIIDAAVNRWTESTLFDEVMLARLDGLAFLIADLEGDALALMVDDTVIIDVDAAGHGWFVDETPYQDSEFIPQGNDEELAAKDASDAYGDMDLLTVVMHELGHVFGYQDLDADAPNNDFEIMSDTLDEGMRYLQEDTFSDQSQGNSDSLISMDLTPDESAAEDTLDGLVNNNPWLIKYLVDGASEESDPNKDITVVIIDEDAQDSGDDSAAPPPSNNGKKK